ncbi:tail protein X [Planktotalea sp.]|uniref:tail protein X n=1 Tax=Planktotalea sp. TaxID=2029877 RepID=UPI003D6AF252
MSKEFFEHITTSGDRWDLIAFDYYGDATLIKPIMMANPDLLSDPQSPAPLVFDKGVSIRVPVLPVEAVVASQLPPWKR